MKFGISTASFFGKELTENTFEIMESLGIKGAEVFLTTYCEYENSFADLLKKKKGNVEIFSVHTLNTQFEPQLYNNAPRTFEDSARFYEKVLYCAKLLGAKEYTFHGPARLKRREYIFNYPDLAEKTLRLIGIAEKYGVELAYENVHWAYFYMPEFIQNLKPLVPSLRTVLDIKQAMQSRIDYRKFVYAMGDSIVNLHLCDYDSNGKLFLPGRGTFDFTEFFRFMRDTGYDGFCTMELYSGDYNNYGEVKTAFEYIKECADKAGYGIEL